jgi:hypothetical protein
MRRRPTVSAGIRSNPSPSPLPAHRLSSPPSGELIVRITHGAGAGPAYPEKCTATFSARAGEPRCGRGRTRCCGRVGENAKTEARPAGDSPPPRTTAPVLTPASSGNQVRRRRPMRPLHGKNSPEVVVFPWQTTASPRRRLHHPVAGVGDVDAAGGVHRRTRRFVEPGEGQHGLAA